MPSRNAIVSVRRDRRFEFTHGVSEALAAPTAQRKAAVSQVLRRHPGVALSLLSRPTLKRVLIALGFSLAAAGVATHFPSLPNGGVAALAPTPAGNQAMAARTWSSRAWNAMPTRTQAANVAGLIATAVNPMNIFYSVAVSGASRSQDALEHTLHTYEQSVNQAAVKMNMYLSWTMFIAFIAVISHFIPMIAGNIRRTVHVLTTGNAYQVATLAGNVTTRAIENGGRTSRSRSRSRSRPRITNGRPTGSRPRLAAPPIRRTASVTARRLPTNAELLARLN